VHIAGICNYFEPTIINHTDKWSEDTYAESSGCSWCHVQIPSKYHHLLPDLTNDESVGLERTWDEEFTKDSRLACMIKLDKKHDGMVVFVPDAPPTDI